MKIGVQTRPWGPERNRGDLAGVLAEVKSAGYDGIEIGAQHLGISKPQEFRKQLAGAGLEVAGVHVGGEIYNPASVNEALANLERIIGFAGEAGALFVPFSGKMKSDKSVEEFQVQAESLNRIGALCQKAGVRLAYHNHYWEIEHDLAELSHLIQNTDPALVSLCLDVAWVHRGAAKPAEVARSLVDRVAYFHAKDTKDGEWKELGQGEVDLLGVFEVVRSREFPWMVVEQDETKRTAVESARMSRAFIKQNLGV